VAAVGAAFGDYLYWTTPGATWAVGSTEVKIGANAGQAAQGANSVAIGSAAGVSTATSAVSIGPSSGSNNANNSVSIGSASSARIANGIVIGANTILGATGATGGIVLNGGGLATTITPATWGTYITPIRSLNGLGSLQPLTYNETTSELISGSSTAQTFTATDEVMDLTRDTFIWSDNTIANVILPDNPMYVGQLLRIVRLPTGALTVTSGTDNIVGSFGTVVTSVTINGSGLTIFVGFAVGGSTPRWARSG
jgi:hypothetical protein